MANTDRIDLLNGQDLALPIRRYDRFTFGGCVRAIFAILAILAIARTQFRQASAASEQNGCHSAQQTTLPSFSGLVERVAPAVVSIRVKSTPSAVAARDEEGDEHSSERNGPAVGAPLGQFFDGQKPVPPHNERRGSVPSEPVQGQGSGFFISSDGYIVTNSHVVEGALKVEVVTSADDVLEAKVIGSDPAIDLALIKVEGTAPFPVASFSRVGVKVGDWVIALGNPFGLEGTVTAGIVSALERDIGMGPYDNYIQIDAPVNKGNSGGPAFNQSGEVIGVNTAIFSPSGGSVGIAFAIPAKTVEQVIAQLKEKGHVTRGWLGVQVQAVTPELADSLGLKQAKGALVSAAAQDSPAEAGGIRRGDVILQIDGAIVKDSRDMARKIAAIAPETTVSLAILRNNQREVLPVKLGQLEDDEKHPLSGKGFGNQVDIEALGLSVVSNATGQGEASGGLAVVNIRPDGKAADAGLMQGDVLLSVNGASLADAATLETALKSAKAAGKKHALALVQRGGTQVFVALPTELG